MDKEKRFEFTIIMPGYGTSPDIAWQDALDTMANDSHFQTFDKNETPFIITEIDGKSVDNMIDIGVLTSDGKLCLHTIEGESDKIDEFIYDKYGNNCQWQQIESMSDFRPDDKPYIFLTYGGTTEDDAGNEVENCQYLAIAKGIDVLTAFNNMLSDKSFAGDFDSCFAYQLSADEIKGSFDLSASVEDKG